MKKIPLIRPQLNAPAFERDCRKIINSGILTKGEFVHRFENNLEHFLGSKHAFATTSATTALHLSLVSAGIGAGDKVLVSDFSFPASGNVVAQVGAKPIFVDINLQTFCLDVDDLEKKIRSHKGEKLKGILVVHPFGYPAEMDKIMKIARQHRLIVIEDAACAIGSTYKGKYLGTWGDLGCFSFHPRKVITTGEGGAIVTNNPALARQIEILRNHGSIKTAEGLRFIDNGFNYRMNEFQAALGVEQLKTINKMRKKRQQIAAKYRGLLENNPLINLMEEPKDGDFNWQSFVVLLDRTINRNKVIKKMAKAGIETTIGTYAMHAEPAFKKFEYKAGDLVNSFIAFQQSLTLPLSVDLTGKEIKYISSSLTRIIKELNGK